MGVFPLVARVGCLRGGAIRLLEEWSPIPFGGGQNPAYRPSGSSFSGSRCDPEKGGLFVWRARDLVVGLRVSSRGGRGRPSPPNFSHQTVRLAWERDDLL